MSELVAGLLGLVFAHPGEAVKQARAVLAGSPTPWAASVAHQAIGIVQRDFGDLHAALAELRQALTLARRSGSAEREADVLATFGIALVHQGRTSAGLAALDQAVAGSSGTHRARVRFRRGGALWVLGRHEDALADLRSADLALRRAGDTVWIGRVLAVRGQVQLALGAVERAAADFTEAERLFAETDQEHDSAVAAQNLGLTAFRSGDLPTALARFEQADRRFHRLATPMPELVADRCAALLAAGLPNEARAEADAAIAEMAVRHGQSTRRAELLLVAGRAALASKDPRAALERARDAVRLFTAQRREWWRQHARLLTLQARFALDPATARLAPARDVAHRLHGLRAPDRVQAHLLAGRIALATARFAPARDHLAVAADARRRGPAITRAAGWLAHALLADADDDTRRVLSACRRGLDVLDEHQLTLGASELRARMTDHGAELAELALRTCLATARPRRLLTWSERWRATVCAVPAVRPPRDSDVLRDLAALRATTTLLDQTLANGAPVGTLAARARRLERRIQDRTRRQPGEVTGVPDRHDVVGPLLAALGADRLAAIVAIDGGLHVLVCGAGKIRRVAAGRTAVAARQLESACWLLRRLAYGPAPTLAGKLLARLDALGHQLQRTLLGAAVDSLGDGDVVIVPPGRFHAVPWALLPCLRNRAHTVAPSATAWLNARCAPRPATDDVVLVRGPELASHDAEIPYLTAINPGAHVLENGAATAPAVLKAMDGSSLVHLAAHGWFRADSPMFSSIRLADGPLTVHDLHHLHRAPYRIVLPCCDSGVAQPTGADELLGLSAALLPLGTAGIVATVVPVNDAATVPLMRALHTALKGGATMAGSLAVARDTTSDSPLGLATAWSFVALGAA